VSGESEAKINDVFIDKLGAKYPFVRIKAAVKQAYGIRAFPSYRVIAPDGTVHSERSPSDAVIEKLLAEVTLAPKLPDETRYAPVVKMWEKKQHAKLRTYFGKMLRQNKLDAEMRTVFEEQQAELDKRAKKQLERVSKLAMGPDYFAAKAKLQELQKEWAGFAAADSAKEQLRQFTKDVTVKKGVAAGKALKKLLGKYDPSKQSQARKLRVALRKFAKKYKGTHAGSQAKKQLNR
jgi:hypothetical protein